MAGAPAQIQGKKTTHHLSALSSHAVLKPKGVSFQTLQQPHATPNANHHSEPFSVNIPVVSDINHLML